MAEDRELFRDLLNRIGQPYRPAGSSRRPTRTRWRFTRRRRSACPPIIRPAFTLGGTGGGIAATETPSWRPVAQRGSAPARSTRSWSSGASVGWQEIEYEVMRDARRHLHHRLQHGERRPAGRPHRRLASSSRRSRRCSDHESTSCCARAALTIIRALGIEGGCNVQFALRPDSSRLLRHRGQPARQPLVGAGLEGDRLPDRPRRRQDRDRPAAGRDPERRHRQDGRRLRARARLRAWSRCRASRSTSSRRPTARSARR